MLGCSAGCRQAGGPGGGWGQQSGHRSDRHVPLNREVSRRCFFRRAPRTPHAQSSRGQARCREQRWYCHGRGCGHMHQSRGDDNRGDACSVQHQSCRAGQASHGSFGCSSLPIVLHFLSWVSRPVSCVCAQQQKPWVAFSGEPRDGAGATGLGKRQGHRDLASTKPVGLLGPLSFLALGRDLHGFAHI